MTRGLQRSNAQLSADLDEALCQNTELEAMLAEKGKTVDALTRDVIELTSKASLVRCEAI